MDTIEVRCCCDAKLRGWVEREDVPAFLEATKFRLREMENRDVAIDSAGTPIELMRGLRGFWEARPDDVAADKRDNKKKWRKTWRKK